MKSFSCVQLLATPWTAAHQALLSMGFARQEYWSGVPLPSPQLLSHAQLFVTPWTAEGQASLSFTISQSLLKLMSIESMMPSNHLILCPPLFLLPSIFPSIRVFSSELALHIRWPKYWRFSISLSNEYSGLIFFRFDWFDLLVVQGTHKRVFSNTAVQKHQFFSRTLEWAAIFFCRGSSNKGIEFVCLLRGRHIFYH